MRLSVVVSVGQVSVCVVVVGGVLVHVLAALIRHLQVSNRLSSKRMFIKALRIYKATHFEYYNIRKIYNP